MDAGFVYIGGRGKINISQVERNKISELSATKNFNFLTENSVETEPISILSPLNHDDTCNDGYTTFKNLEVEEIVKIDWNSLN